MNALLLLGPAGQSPATEANYRSMVDPVARSLGLATAACRLAFRELDALNAIRAFMAAGLKQIVVMPLTLEAEDHQHEAIYGGLDWMQAQTPGVTIRYAPTVSPQPSIIEALADEVAASLATTGVRSFADTALLLLGRGGYNAGNNAEIARIARLLWEERPYGWVEAAYYRQTSPGIADGLQRCCRLGAKRIVVVPYWFELGTSQRHLATQVATFQAQQPAVPVTITTPLGNHPGIIDALAQTVRAAAGAQTPLRRHSHMHGHHAHTASATATAPAFLPPRYRNGAAVRAVPMGAAPLVYDADGQVAWHSIWGKDDPDSPFCELALAGGPAHRGELLEPVTPADVQADLTGYGRVLAELTRGIQMTTGLRTRLSQAPGWIGVECHSEAMALWLLRAIVVENVSVRREGAVLYLPAGPAFRLEHEIKNVITALAKTHHYWQEHLHG